MRYPAGQTQGIEITSVLMAPLGGSGSSWPRILNSSQFHTFNLRLSGLPT